jgi:UDP-N-acetyl-D-glucosamine dehydrogenase
MDAFDLSVVGLGFIGLPTAVAAAGAGLRVVGVDTSAKRVRDILDVAPGCGLNSVPEDELRELINGRRIELRDTTSPAPIAAAHVLCVPTPPGINGGADLAPLLTAADRVATTLRRGDLVLVQSTCPPGTVERVVLPRLVSGSGLAPGTGFSLAYSPMRIDPGNNSFTLRGLPRVVAGTTPRCRAAAEDLLRRVADHLVPVSTIHAAELVKVFENTFRLVNISLVNELAALCRSSQVDFDEVLDAASAKPFGFLRHQPGPGAGGECIPVAAGFFAASAREHGVTATVVETAIALNQAMPAFTLHLVRQLLAANRLRPLRDSRVLVVGVTYKPDVPNIKQSAAIRILEQLRLETDVGYHDPYLPTVILSDGTTLHSEEIDPRCADLVLLLTKHSAVDEALLLRRGAPVLDCSSGEPRLLCWRGPAPFATAS